jgi:hypothetical protein
MNSVGAGGGGGGFLRTVLFSVTQPEDKTQSTAIIKGKIIFFINASFSL